ncbi:MAG TPA: methyltransferase domain-containing protein [Sedimentisphaerales bacterium]|nr:methyltransferase domain-containing protein [Sedimentisphaerales bacterium]HRS12534.1 methyltransferase domain-containing protein [Sedimentisphaerales bacterium]HRV49172.1 methyltransferase domain-containing protein [Sedimentisphaerales bacterium]
MGTERLPEFFYEVFDASLPRLGPGDEASTTRAWRTLYAAMARDEGRTAGPMRILDIGCGNGAQTICLAQHVDGSILAMDNHPPFLAELERRAATAGVSAKIQVALRDMHTLTKDDGPFDVVWSEGALFVMGFCEGLTACAALLPSGGGLVVSELAWLRSDPPADCRRFWAEAYPAMASISDNLAWIKACGYEVLEHFAQPESAWWEPYYHPLEQRLAVLRKRCGANAERLALIESIQKEIDVYRRYSAFYGNVSYVMRRR